MASPQVLDAIRAQLAPHAPFAQMAPADLDRLVESVSIVYFEPGALIITPDDGPPDACYIVKQGVVRGERRSSVYSQRNVELTAGEMFPVGSVLTDRPVLSHYVALGDVFLFKLPKIDFLALVRASDPFAVFCQRRLSALLDLSQAQVQAAYAQQATLTQSLNMTLGNLVRREAIACTADDTLETAFRTMERASVGSIIVIDDDMAQADEPVVGILTRADLISKVILPQVPLSAPVRSVMTSPVIMLDARATAGDAILAMAQHGVKHLPVVRGARVLGVVSERDLFALQRLTVRQIGDAIRNAASPDVLIQVADDIRHLSRNLVAQGAGAGQITSLISRLNDLLTARLVELIAPRFGVRLDEICWIALGSEGREEQTIATDQDNGLIVADGAETPIAACLAMAQAVNQALDQAGYPLCKGGVMAGNPQWCLHAADWREIFGRWIDGADPEALLNASIFFDLRAVAGGQLLATELREFIARHAASQTRFLKLLADSALRNRAHQSRAEKWGGSLLGSLLGDDAEPVDLKLHGTMAFVDAARVYGLALGLDSTSTVARLRGAADQNRLPTVEVNAWIDAFQFLQLMRLRVQHAGVEAENANRLDPTTLSDLDRRILKEALRLARTVQQRLEIDYHA